MKSVSLAVFVLTIAICNEATARSIGVLYPQIICTSNYRYNGLSNTNNEPAIQASLYLWRPDGLYAGVWVSSVDYSFPGSPTWEVDAYGGYKKQVGKTEISLEAMGSFFPDQPVLGPTFNFYQTKTGFQHTEGALTIGGAVSWSPEGSFGGGDTTTPVGTMTWQATSWLAIGGTWGTVISQEKQDRKFWDVGATATWKSIALNLRYADTDLERHQCFHSSWCEPSVIGKMTLNVPILGFSKHP